MRSQPYGSETLLQPFSEQSVVPGTFSSQLSLLTPSSLVTSLSVLSSLVLSSLAASSSLQ